MSYSYIHHPEIIDDDLFSTLSPVEKIVLHALTDDEPQPDSIKGIAEKTRMSELQTTVALQLLEHKKLIMVEPKDSNRT